MLTGLSGHLVSVAYLDTVFLPGLAPPRHQVATDTAARIARLLRDAHRRTGPASGARAVLDLFALPMAQALGFDIGSLSAHGSLGFTGTLLHRGTVTAVLLTVPWGAPAGPLWRHAVRAGLQHQARWCLAINGTSLRVFDAGATWTRRHLEADLHAVSADPASARALAALLSADAMTCDAARGRSALEDAVSDSLDHGTAVCRSLRHGVLDALGHLAAALGAGRAQAHADVRFEQALTIVYRMLFLLFAESRGLVPVWHRLYRDRYTVGALARRATLRPDAPGLWDALRAISRMAHAGCEVGGLRVTAFNGRLFAPSRTPLAEQVGVPDHAVARALTALTTASGGAAGRQRIAYRDLGVEQLGAVYEEILEYDPPTGGAATALRRSSTLRKHTGSFYTPRSMTDYLVRRTLAPLVAGRSENDILSLRIVDPAMGSGAFLVAACRYLADAVRHARREGGDVPPDDDRDEMASIRRLVAQRCLYGVDLNPTAVQLARLSLWLATLSADRPLTFLDHRLATGDSLAGATFADLARTAPGARAGVRRPLPLFDDELAGPLAGALLPGRYRLAQEPDDSARVVREKERALERLGAPGTPLSEWRRLANLWCAGWFATPVPDARLFAELRAAALGGQGMLPDRLTAPWHARAADAARRHRFFHWELEFPEVFFGHDGRRLAHGGFDAVLGNPPWDMVRADTGDLTARRHDRADVARYVRFLRDSGLYRDTGTGHVNRYQLFVERALHLVRPGGRLGLIVPAGLLLDHGSARLRHRLFDQVELETIAGFDNRDAIFPIHRSVRFLVLSATSGRPTKDFRVRFGLRTPAALDPLPDHAREDPPDALAVPLSRGVLDRLDPRGLTVPDLQSPADLALLLHLVRTAPALSDPRGWGVSFGRELNATDDRRHFVPRGPGCPRRLLPIVEGKQVEPFRVEVTRSTTGIATSVARHRVDPGRTWHRNRLAYRDVASATNRLTVIAAMLPRGTLSTHTLFCLKTPLEDADQWCLLALLNSFVANYVARRRVTTHVTTEIVGGLPAPRPARGSRTHRALSRLARTLAEGGVSSQPEAYVELQARVAALYGLSRDQFVLVVSTFPLVDEAIRLAAVERFTEWHEGGWTS
jgi:hypothetical protein